MGHAIAFYTLSAFILGFAMLVVTIPYWLFISLRVFLH